MAYIGTSPSQGVRHRYLFTATSGQTTFTGADDDGRTLSYTDTKFMDVFLNGVLLDPNSDYTATTGNSVVLTSGAATDDLLEVIAFDTFSVFSGTFGGDVTVGGALTVDGAITAGAGTHTIGDGTGASQVIIKASSATNATLDFGDADDTNIGRIQYNNTDNSMLFRTNNTEHIRLDSSGNLLVGKTVSSSTTEGCELRDGQSGSGFAITAASTGASTLSLNRKSSDGDIAIFRKDGTSVGSIGVVSATPYFANSNNSKGIRIYSSGFAACTGSGAFQDNSQDVGASSVRWDDIYATNGTIQTSDRNEKQDIEELSEAEQRVAVACKGLLRKFRWKDSVAEKGDDARIHFGIIAQDLQDAFADEGLDAGRYAMFISSTWWETQTDVPAVEADEENGIEAQDAYTRTDTFDTAEEAPEGAVERTRLGVRYPELLAFIIGAM